MLFRSEEHVVGSEVSVSTYQRPIVKQLTERVQEPRRTIQVIAGPRQTGKTTALRQMIGALPAMAFHMVRAAPGIKSTREWLAREWDEARTLARHTGEATLVVDEVQAIPQWSSVVMDEWDADGDAGINLKVVLSGSSALLLQKGLRESLTGRFELIRCQQWDYQECVSAFAFTLDDYLLYGGYPGAAPYIQDQNRWVDYMDDAIIRPSISRDIVALDEVRKPALMEALFYIGAPYSAQEISYRKLLGQLDDAGNATTIAHYLDLLSDAGLITGLKKYTEKPLKTSASSPRLMVHDTSLMTAPYGQYRTLLLTDPARRGHLVESAVGAYLIRRSRAEHFDVFWWRERNAEVDFVLRSGEALTAIEVKGGAVKGLGGLDAFHALYPASHSLIIGSPQVPIEEFLSGNVPLF